MFDILITGGKVVDGSGLPWFQADVGIRGDRIAAIGQLAHADTKLRIDAAGKVVAPGFIDAHVHGDLTLLADPYHEPAIRQGVTTYILGQDGVAMAPGSPATVAYMRRYTAGFSGVHELPQTWTSIADYLELFDRRCALNVACLVPNGNLRMEVIGLENRPPSGLRETSAMGRPWCAKRWSKATVGLSTGLDYIPSRYASTEELIALCREMASFGGVYVTHQRRYDPAGVLESMDEVFRIGRESGVPVHISHFNSRAEIVLPRLDEGRREGIDATYDLYCYLAGSTILGMKAALPPLGATPEASTRRWPGCAIPDVRGGCWTWFADPRRTARKSIRASTFVARPDQRHLEGKTVSGGDRAGRQIDRRPHLRSPRSEVGHGGRLRGAASAARRSEDVRQLMRPPMHDGKPAATASTIAGSHPHPARLRLRTSPATWATTSATNRPGASKKRCNICPRTAPAVSASKTAA